MSNFLNKCFSWNKRPPINEDINVDVLLSGMIKLTIALGIDIARSTKNVDIIVNIDISN